MYTHFIITASKVLKEKEDRSQQMLLGERFLLQGCGMSHKVGDGGGVVGGEGEEWGHCPLGQNCLCMGGTLMMV